MQSREAISPVRPVLAQLRKIKKFRALEKVSCFHANIVAYAREEGQQLRQQRLAYLESRICQEGRVRRPILGREPASAAALIATHHAAGTVANRSDDLPPIPGGSTRTAEVLGFRATKSREIRKDRRWRDPTLGEILYWRISSGEGSFCRSSK